MLIAYIQDHKEVEDENIKDHSISDDISSYSDVHGILLLRWKMRIEEDSLLWNLWRCLRF